MSAGIGLGMGNEKRERGFRMDLCKRRRLQCECSVVHSGKSLSHAVLVEQHHAKSQKCNKSREECSDWELLVL